MREEASFERRPQDGERHPVERVRSDTVRAAPPAASSRHRNGEGEGPAPRGGGRGGGRGGDGRSSDVAREERMGSGSGAGQPVRGQLEEKQWLREVNKLYIRTVYGTVSDPDCHGRWTPCFFRIGTTSSKVPRSIKISMPS